MSDSVKNIHDFYKYNYNELLKEYIDTIEERDFLMLKKQIYLDAKHICMSFDLMIKEIELKIRIKKLNIEKSIVKSTLKSKLIFDEENMNNIINKNISPLIKQILAINNLAEEARTYIISYEKNSYCKTEFSNLYKKMLVRISPIFNKMDKNKERLWEKTELAYIYNDIGKLKMISNVLLDNYKPTKVYTSEELINEINELKKEIKSMEDIFPFNIDIDDEIYIKTYRKEIEDRLYILNKEENKLLKEVDVLRAKL